LYFGNIGSVKMKKAIAIILMLSSLLLLFSCGGYDPVESSEEEARVVMTARVENETYEIKYELYRALFLNYKSDVDGGDSTVWTGENSQNYIDEINKIIIDRAASIYATFAIAEELGIKPYSADIESEIKKLVKLSVEGGDYEGELFLGYGSYDAYLEALKAMNMNYSVQTLMYRYMLVTQAIEEYFKGEKSDGVQLEDPTGKIEYTEDDVRDFYEGDDCVRVLRAFLQSEYRTREAAERVRSAMMSKTSELDVAYCIIQNSMTSADEVMNGHVVGRYSLDSYYYAEFTEAAFSLSTGEVSEIIEVVNGINDGYFIIYKATKSDEHFEKCYEEIEAAYLDNAIGERISEAVKSLKESVSFMDLYSEIVHSDITME
jgi:hypothetical protein